MARKFLLPKPLIYVFCEGESEQAYTAYLKEIFRDVAVIKIPSELGLFSTAKAKFAKDAKFRDIVSEVDEIWFFFDVEKSDQPNWDNHLKIIRHLRNLRKKPGVRVRLPLAKAPGFVSFPCKLPPSLRQKTEGYKPLRRSTLLALYDLDNCFTYHKRYDVA